MSLSQFLQEAGFNAKGVVLELNRRIVNRSLYDTTILASEDSLEIVHFVGGGAL